MQESIVYPITFITERLALDGLTVTPGGILSLRGWGMVDSQGSFPNFVLILDGIQLEPVEKYRLFRSDALEAVPELLSNFTGFGLDYLVTTAPENSVLRLELEGDLIWETTITRQFAPPDYDHFFYDSNIKKQSDVFGCGPAISILNVEVVSLMEEQILDTDKVLDFGCGTGELINLLRKRGVEAQGIELDTVDGRNALSAQAKPYVTFYNGLLPLPYLDGEFDVVTATEVLEHIDEPEAFFRELKRISKRLFIMTVPDGTGIPRGHSQKVVPWHLLEATHVNFFTQKSLGHILHPLWDKLTMHKFGFTNLPRTFFANNIACVCEGPKS